MQIRLLQNFHANIVYATLVREVDLFKKYLRIRSIHNFLQNLLMLNSYANLFDAKTVANLNCAQFVFNFHWCPIFLQHLCANWTDAKFHCKFNSCINFVKNSLSLNFVCNLIDAQLFASFNDRKFACKFDWWKICVQI